MRDGTSVNVVAKEAPSNKKNREPNTLYAGPEGLLQMDLRVYLPDVARDATGDAGLPADEGLLADGARLTTEEVLEQWNRPLTEGIKAGMTLEQWNELKSAPDNDPALKSVSAPAREAPVMERFFNSKYINEETFEVKGVKK